MDFAGLLPWGPNGLASRRDERAMDGAARRNPWADQMAYLTRNGTAGTTGDHLAGWESSDPVNFAYVPTEYQVGAALAMINMQQNATANPIQQNDPALAQLTRSLYVQAAQLWQEIAAADTEGWSV